MSDVKTAALNLVDAITENISNSVDDVRKEICGMAKSQNNKLLDEAAEVMQEFVDRVEKGEVTSTYTYEKFKKILEKYKESK